ncbi:MAG: hypothetical protein JSW00_03690 [Thermoplasmata archaeon]|nr:MAG: hypothetical protein JSW00_03690 [Thermoplasmata archaeon]
MTDNSKEDKKIRLREIEDRKIEILLKTEKIGRCYSEEVSKLRSEYSQLDKEQYYLQLELISEKQKG